jgi:hypothetical protein
MNSIEDQTAYIARVGTAFAVAMFRHQANTYGAKASRVEEVRNRLATALENHFETDNNSVSIWEDDETCFLAAFEAYEQIWHEKEKELKAWESIAIALNLPGTDPGRQEHLDGNGINISLASIEQELATY